MECHDLFHHDNESNLPHYAKYLIESLQIKLDRSYF